MTPEILSKLEYAFAIGGSPREACAHADISESTFYRWKEKNPQLWERFNRLRERPVLKARNTVYKAIGEDGELAFKFLKAKRSNEFKESIGIEQKSVHYHIVDLIEQMEKGENDDRPQADRQQALEDAEFIQDKEQE